MSLLLWNVKKKVRLEKRPKFVRRFALAVIKPCILTSRATIANINKSPGCLFILTSYTPTTKCGGSILDSLYRVGRSVGRSVRPSPIRVRSKTPLLMEGFPSNLNDTFTSPRGCAEPMLPTCQLKVKITVKGQIFNKQILHIMSCPLQKPYTNGKIFFKIEWHIHLN